MNVCPLLRKGSVFGGAYCNAAAVKVVVKADLRDREVLPGWAP
jgi:hypothetical protein